MTFGRPTVKRPPSYVWRVTYIHPTEGRWARLISATSEASAMFKTCALYGIGVDDIEQVERIG